MTHDYDDIISLPHYEPKHHPRMPKWSRAAQFAPFAALTGYDAAIREAARLISIPALVDDVDAKCSETSGDGVFCMEDFAKTEA